MMFKALRQILVIWQVLFFRLLFRAPFKELGLPLSMHQGLVAAVDFFPLPLLPAFFQDTQEKETGIPEREEEAKLKAKYPNLGLQKPGGSDFLMKRLQKGVGEPPGASGGASLAGRENSGLPSNSNKWKPGWGAEGGRLACGAAGGGSC